MSVNEGRETTSMSAANGEARPDSVAIATPGKRKRSAQEDKPGADSNSSAPRDKAVLQENLRSLVDLLLK